MHISVILGLGFLQEDKLFSFSTDFHGPEVFLTATKHRIYAELWIGRTSVTFLTPQQHFSVIWATQQKPHRILISLYSAKEITMFPIWLKSLYCYNDWHTVSSNKAKVDRDCHT